jgi:hypothetical protein
VFGKKKSRKTSNTITFLAKYLIQNNPEDPAVEN